MRRKQSADHVESYKPYDLVSDVGMNRLALIGAIGLSWNMLEGGVDVALPLALELAPPMWVHVTSRINGFDGKIELIKQAAKRQYGLPDKHCRTIYDSLGKAGEYKKYRDAVVHVQIMDPTLPVAPTFSQRGDTFEVLITEEALVKLHGRIAAASAEVDQIVVLFSNLAQYRGHSYGRSPSEDEKKSAVRGAREALSQLRDLQAKHSKLPQLPKFPDEHPSPPVSAEQKVPLD